MGFWGIRAGASGERERDALEHGVALIGWGDLPDIAAFSSRERLKSHLLAAYPDQPAHGLSGWSSQLWAFAHGIAEGDLVALPRKGAGAVAVGEVEGQYAYEPAAPAHARHRRPVRWLERQMPTARLDDDIRYSLRSLMTVFRVRPDGAETRIRALLGEAGRAGGDGVLSCPVNRSCPGSRALPCAAGPASLPQIAMQQIATRIGQHFKGERLEGLVAAVLEAGGLRTLRTAGGRDGGIDIVAQGGPFGFGHPRLAVQVKSTGQPVEQAELDAFCAAARRGGSDVGLFVSWNGFRGTGRQQAMQAFFTLRQWDGHDLVAEMLRVYDRLDPALHEALPLTRIWSLADDALARPAATRGSAVTGETWL